MREEMTSVDNCTPYSALTSQFVLATFLDFIALLCRSGPWRWSPHLPWSTSSAAHQELEISPPTCRHSVSELVLKTLVTFVSGKEIVLADFWSRSEERRVG